jgi:hypothetical protein
VTKPNKNNKRTIDTEMDYENSRFTYGSYGRKQLTDISLDNIMVTRDGGYQNKSMKDSVVRRCRNVLSRN